MKRARATWQRDLAAAWAAVPNLAVGPQMFEQDKRLVVCDDSLGDRRRGKPMTHE